MDERPADPEPESLPELPFGARIGPLRAARPARAVLSLEALHALIAETPALRVRASQLRYRIPRVGRLAVRARLVDDLAANTRRQLEIRDALLDAWGPRIEWSDLEPPGPPSEVVVLGERGREALGPDA